MSVVEALNLLKQVCAEFKGNLKEHQFVQQALQIVEKECTKDLEVKTVKND